jgi:hypothetical protein
MKTIGFALAMFAAVCIVMHVTGCSATCAVIDLANRACPLVVEYTDRSGEKRTVTVSNDDAVGLAAIKAAARPDGGAP